MTKKLLAVLLTIAVVLVMVPTVLAAPAADGIEFETLGYGAPPADLGGYLLAPANGDVFDDGDEVDVIPSFAGGINVITADEAWVEARFVPDSWSTWSHGYEGIVYFVRDNTVTLELPANIKAFVVYAEPDSWDIFDFEVQTNDGEVFVEEVDGDAGALGFGFYSTGDATIASVKITTTDEDFAFSEIFLGVGINDVLTLEETGEDLLPAFEGMYADILAATFAGDDVADVTLLAPAGEELLDQVVAVGTYDAIVLFELNGEIVGCYIADGLVVTPKVTVTTLPAEPTETGDNMPLALMAVLMVSGAAALLVVFKARKARA